MSRDIKGNVTCRGRVAMRISNNAHQFFPSGLLTQRLIETQNRDIESSKLVEEFKLKLALEQGRMLVLENKLSDQLKLQDSQHKRVTAHVQLLSRTICYLRAQFSGAVPLQRQQRLGEAVRALIIEKQTLNKKLVQVTF